MLKLFRHIRKKMLKDGKLKSYLLYGVGEIILVVIGILIALQVNNWNQKRIAHNAEAELIQNILNDLEADRMRYQNNLSEIEILEGLYQKLYQVGVLGLSDINIQNPQDVRRIPSYDQILDTDYTIISDQISNKVIRQQLLDYDLEQKRLGVYNQELRAIVVNRMRSFLAENGIYKLDAVFNSKKQSTPFIDESELKELSKTETFQQLLFSAKLKLSHLKEKLEDLVTTNKELATLMEENN